METKMDTLLHQVGALTEARRLAGESLTVEDRNFISMARNLSKDYALSESMRRCIENEGAKQYREENV